jgi:catechol 2,3-dioxygenase-like lactoylglutathione lyase family enzyme
MKRLHVHVSVPDLAESIKFYTGMFAAEPTVVKPDYAKWMLDDPRVNFAISQRGAQVGVNHLGIQVEDAAELGEMQCRLGALQADVLAEEGAACCYAKSDKYWVNDPAGIPWETFHTLGNIPVYGKDTATSGQEEPASSCCAPAPKAAAGCCAPAASSCGTSAGSCG